VATCLRCGLNADEQVKSRRADMQGLCYSGRCVVTGEAWLVQRGGQPLYGLRVAAFAAAHTDAYFPYSLMTSGQVENPVAVLHV
jgi:hypothetical protein